MPLKSCNVAIEDRTGVTHSVEATAETLYEAVAQALVAYLGEPWSGDRYKGLNTATVTVRHPAVKHVVKIQEFENWLNSSNKSPADMLQKERLRRLLNGSGQKNL